jgi:Coenzyme PQQ synthesis protein D (PqqD)
VADLPPGRITIPDGVVRRAFGDDKVLLNLATGHYHGLNPTGGYMVALLDETGDADETARRTADELGVDLERVREDLAQLLDALTERDLVVIEP